MFKLRTLSNLSSKLYFNRCNNKICCMFVAIWELELQFPCYEQVQGKVHLIFICNNPEIPMVNFCMFDRNFSYLLGLQHLGSRTQLSSIWLQKEGKSFFFWHDMKGEVTEHTSSKKCLWLINHSCISTNTSVSSPVKHTSPKLDTNAWNISLVKLRETCICIVAV